MLTRQNIEALVASETYSRPTGGTLTVCALTLTNGANVTGESNCINPADFDADIGKKAAREDAIRKLWTLEGYAVKRDAATLANRAARAGHEAMRVIEALDTEQAPSLLPWPEMSADGRTAAIRNALRVFANPAITPDQFANEDSPGAWESTSEIERACIAAFILVCRSIAGA